MGDADSAQDLPDLTANLSIDTNILQNSTIEENPDNTVTMPQSKADFIKLAGPILNYKYSGDPLKLSTFLTDIELVEELAEEEQKDLCFKLIKSKLEGRALEAMPDEYTTVAHITNALKEKIKPDSSKVIAGKLTSLRLIKGNFSSFQKQAEELAEAFRRSLVNEKISKEKAEELTIEEMKKLCRKTANTDIVKSVIQSQTFTSPAEVIPTFIPESDTARQEHQQKKGFQNKNQNNGNKKPWNKNGKNNDQNGKNGNFGNKNNQGNFKKYNGGNSNYGGNKQGQRGQGQRTETIRIVQGNPQGPSEGGASSSNAPELVYQLTPHHQG